jgi:hypothetical protein
MAYRDELDAAHGRVRALEAELSTVRGELALIKAGRDGALVRADRQALTQVRAGASGRWLGGPARWRAARSWAGSLDATAFEDLVEVIRNHTGDLGRTEIMKRSLLWASSTVQSGVGPFLTVSVRAREGEVVLEVVDHLGNLIGVVYGGIGGGVGGGGVVVPILVSSAVPVLGPAVFAAWFGGVYLGCRLLTRRLARRRIARACALFDELGQEIEARLAGAPVTGTP